tara:strand:+ start:270 stop:527 length:258 start_codon:yes stop_codon:yes gene_type:complete
MSKTLKSLVDKNPDKFSETWIEDNGNDERGIDYWVACNGNYFFPRSECQIMRTNNVKEMIEEMRCAVQGEFLEGAYGWRRTGETK